jgi:hypothetical protein
VSTALNDRVRIDRGRAQLAQEPRVDRRARLHVLDRGTRAEGGKEHVEAIRRWALEQLQQRRDVDAVELRRHV